MSELPSPRVRTEKLIAIAEEVASRPLPLQARILLPTILLIVGIGAFWFGFRDDGDDQGPSPTTTLGGFPTSVVVTTPP